MEDTTNTPITLIVKAPNQRIADVTVDCMLEWTVRKLKSHLSDVYPNQPVSLIITLLSILYIFAMGILFITRI